MKKIITALLCLLLTSTIVKSEEHRKVVAVLDNDFYLASIDSNKLCSIEYQTRLKPGKNLVSHATKVVRIIKAGVNFEKFCIAVVSYSNIQEYRSGLKLIRLWGGKVALLNISSSGFGKEPLETELISSIVKSKGVVVVSAGNEYLNLGLGCIVYPACVPVKNKRFRIVAIDRAYSNHGGPVTDLVILPNDSFLSGTSAGAAVVSNRILLNSAK